MGVDHHNAVFSFKGGMGRTDSDATGVVTVIAKDGKKRFPHIRIEPLFNLFDPGWPYTEGNLIFHLAGDFARMTTNATTKVDHHAIFDLLHLFLQGLFLK